MRIRHNKLIGGILLVSGTTIGAGMLALPVVTGIAGFIPTLCLLLLYWCFMTYTAFLFLEVNLWLGDNINLITMARETLGRAGEWFCWGVYLFLLYLLTTAYLAGGGPITADFIYTLTGIQVANWVGSLPLLFVFGFFVYEGTRHVDAVNRLFMFGLAIAFLLMSAMLVPHINGEYLSHTDWDSTLLAVSIVATSFGFHIIIPSLTTYMHHNVKELKYAIVIGSVIPIVVYIIWELVTMGVIPLEGEHGMIAGYEQGANGVKLLVANVGNVGISLISQFFSFFAIVTSFLGVTLSLSDFLADGLRIKKTHAGRVMLFILTFLPPVIFILTYPRAFLSALEFAGAFGVVLLLGLLPIFMAWSARYRKGMKAPITTFGGRPALIIAALFFFGVIVIEIGNKLGIIEGIVR